MVMIPETKSRHAWLLIQLLFANLAFLAEMHWRNWPELGRAEISVFARGLRLLLRSQPPVGVSLSPAADAPPAPRRRRLVIGEPEARSYAPAWFP